MRQSTVFDQIMDQRGGMAQLFELRKPDGSKVAEGIRAYVTGDGSKMLIEDVKLPIQADDEITRELPNGLPDCFIVQECLYNPWTAFLPEHFIVKVRRPQPRQNTPSSSAIQNVFHGPVGNLAQNSSNFTQRSEAGANLAEVGKVIEAFTKHLDELPLDARQKQKAEAQIATLRTELADNPDAEIVTQAGRTLRNITEGAVASLIATAAQPGVWHWVERMMKTLF